MQIDERKRLILGVIVDEYIRTGEPVGSKAVLGCIGMNVSSATIRNVWPIWSARGFWSSRIPRREDSNL